MDNLTAQFFANGYYFPLSLTTPAEADQHNRRLEAFESRHGAMHYRVKPYLISTSAYEIATNPTLLDAVEKLLGPDILLWDSSYVIKEAGSAGYVSWHQDLTYWGLDMQSDDDLVSAWVALTPATRETGCMQVVQASHRRGTLTQKDTFDADNILHRGQTIPDVIAALPADTVVHMELAPGEASFHNGWLVHASNPNSSQTRRVGLVLNYVKPTVRQVVGAKESALLVRGQDRCRHFEPEPPCTVDMSPENLALQLVQERLKRDIYDTA